MKRLLSITISCLSFWCGAATYYVSPTGNDAAAGTEGAPWASLQKATESVPGTTYLQPGDSVVMRGGIYTGADNMIDLPDGQGVSGNSNAPIVISAYPGETPILTDNYSFGASFILRNKSWWKFDGLTFSNSRAWVQFFWVTNFTVTNCHFTTGKEPVSDLSYAGILWQGASQRNRFVNNRVHDFGGPYGTGGTSGTYTLGSTLFMLGNETTDDPCHYNLIEGNEFYSGGHGLIEITSAYNVIRSNFCHNAAFYPTNGTALLWMPNFGDTRTELNPYGAWSARIVKFAEGGDVPNLDFRNVFEDNLFYYSGPAADTGGSFGIEVATCRSIYRRNSIAFTLAAGVYFGLGGSETKCSSNVFYNNTIYSAGLARQFGGTQMSSFVNGINVNHVPDRVFTNYIVNNIVWGCATNAIDDNVYLEQVVRTNWIAVDPLFVSTNGHGYTYSMTNLPNFQLLSNSPAIDKAVFLTTATTSGTSTSLPVANALYFSDGNQCVTGDRIQLEGTTNTATVTLCDWTNHVLHIEPALTFTAGQGVTLAFTGSAPDFGAYEGAGTNAPPPYVPPPSQTTTSNQITAGSVRIQGGSRGF